MFGLLLVRPVHAPWLRRRSPRRAHLISQENHAEPAERPASLHSKKTQAASPMLRRAVAAEARRRISLAPARLAHELAQPQAESVVPERRGLEPSWVPLYKRISKVSHGRPPGIVAAEMDEWLRQRLRLSQDQVLAYVRELTKFKKNEGALEVPSPTPKSLPLVVRCYISGSVLSIGSCGK